MRTSPFRRLLDWSVGHRWLVLTGLALVVSSVHLLASAWFSWHFIATGSRVLYSSSGLHLYALHPELQMGPLTFVLGGLFTVVLPAVLGKWAALVFMLGAGLFAIRDTWYLRSSFDRAATRRWMLAAMVAMVVWTEVAVRFAHLDDVMALVLMLHAVRLAKNRHSLGVAICVGLAIDFKPWAIPMAALLLADRSRLRTTVLVLLGLVLAAWVPFLLADPATSRILGFVIPVSPASSLRALGSNATTTPGWDRSLQLGGGLLLVGLAVLRRRWSAVLMLAVGLRILLDPAVYAYYDSGLLLAAVAQDGRPSRATVPLATGVAFVFVDVSGYLLPATINGSIRTIGLVALLAMALFEVLRRRESAPNPNGTSRVFARAPEADVAPDSDARVHAQQDDSRRVAI